MTSEVIKFPQFAEFTIHISLFINISSENITTIKSNLISSTDNHNKYDYCFLNTKYIISKEHLFQSIYKSLLNYTSKSGLSTRNLNSEIIYNLSPINNIGDALKRFGISEDCPNCIVIKIINNKEEEITKALDRANTDLKEIIDGELIELNDQYIFENFIDLAKFRKLYKLNDVADLNKEDNLQGRLTRLAIGACILRGY
ncbi:component of the KEOPS telomere regulatory complex [Candida dubliniensis CD36]|uniref:EKC/KEOPS complex subunit CGI121 n=1 Tax=Candida dubliniensis (strain CD36 / ATCC MYA-646 / CBS 7987 / NCPF 3949 / NRRL Y-17841) TaxID=573826 RepID=B9WH03_CANDC|nr:component of the KEOPS telomere regulatory complex [Candida dubliniensis CD36]CAX41444.1 component of the KEOPS telomere regulatory complex [Candida dubliniensis CD36]